MYVCMYVWRRALVFAVIILISSGTCLAIQPLVDAFQSLQNKLGDFSRAFPRDLPVMKKITAEEAKKVIDYGEAAQWTCTNKDTLKDSLKPVKLGTSGIDLFSHIPAFYAYGEYGGMRQRLLIVELDGKSQDSPIVPGELKKIIPKEANIYINISVVGHRIAYDKKSFAVLTAYDEDNLLSFDGLALSSCNDNKEFRIFMGKHSLTLHMEVKLFQLWGAQAQEDPVGDTSKLDQDMSKPRPSQISADLLKSKVFVYMHTNQISGGARIIFFANPLASFWSLAILPSSQQLYNNSDFGLMKGKLTSDNAPTYFNKDRDQPDVLVTYNLIVNNEKDEDALAKIFKETNTWKELCDQVAEYANTKTGMRDGKKILTKFAETLRAVGR